MISEVICVVTIFLNIWIEYCLELVTGSSVDPVVTFEC